MIEQVESDTAARSTSSHTTPDERAWALLAADKQSRIERSRSIALDVDACDAAASFASAGTCVVFFAKRENALLRAVKEAQASGDAAEIRRVGKLLVEYFRATAPGAETPLDAARRVREEPVYGELRVAGKVVHRCLTTTAARPLGGVVLPYVGGKLPEGALTLVELARDADSPDLDVVCIAREPNLSALERAAMEASSASCPSMVIGEGQYAIWPAVITAVVLATLTGTACLEVPEEMNAIGLDDQEVLSLGARGSAALLLARRSAVLTGR